MTVGHIEAIEKNVLTVSEAAYHPIVTISGLWAPNVNSIFTGGYIVTGNGLKKMIVNHTDNKLTLLTTMQGLTVGEEIQMCEGCDHTFDTCRFRFQNGENYGGFDYIPKINPFGSTTVF